MNHRCASSLGPSFKRLAVRLFIVVTTCMLGLPAWGYQAQPKASPPATKRTTRPSSQAPTPERHKSTGDDLGWLSEALKDPELMAEVGRLADKLQNGVQLPAARNESRLLPRLPETTTFYVALPNYGEPAHQALQIFQQEIKDSAVLRDFLHKNKLDVAQPEIEHAIEKFYELSQYLGDEVVIAGKIKDKDPSGVLIAEIKKPGLREFLESLNAETFTDPSDRLRIFDSQQLAAANDKDKDKDGGKAPAVLIRKDLVAVGFDLASLRAVDSRLEDRGAKLTTTTLGQKLAQTYHAGASSVLGIDLHKLIELIPTTRAQDAAMLDKTGFNDVNYLVSTYANAGSEVEIAFNGPRHGVASWIAAPRPMGGLDFVSPHAPIALDVVLKSPTEIFDDVREIAGDAAFAPLPQMEEQLKVNLKNELLSKLTGEIAFEMQPILPTGPQGTSFAQSPMGPKPGPFKVILGVTDPVSLQQTLTKLLAAAPVQAGQRTEDGVTINTVTVPGPGDSPTEINYFFLDGYLVVASDRATASQALRQHRSGETLAKSSQFTDALVAGQPANASMILYQDAGGMFKPMISQLPTEFAQLMLASLAKTPPTVFSVYGEPAALRGFTKTNMQAGMFVPLIVAAVAIPSLTRARSEANDSFAASGLRAVNTAQMTYSITYDQGYAPNLATLGPGAKGDCAGANPTVTQACLLDNVLANANCTTGKWCEKSGYKFGIRAVCMQGRCINYAVTATPVNANAGTKSLCTTDDAVIRYHLGAPIGAPLTANECKTWTAIR